MGRPAGYLLHKYLRDPYYLNPVFNEKEKKRESVIATKSGSQLAKCPVNVHGAQRQKAEAKKHEIK